MKIVILAAGTGERLNVTDKPKALIPLVNGQSILALQLAHIARYHTLDDVRVVIGYRKELFYKEHPHLTYVVNPHYAKTNTATSLSLALSGTKEESILWLNGDVVFHHAVIAPLFSERKTAMVVNRSIVGKEEVKYRTDGLGRIVEISKQVQKPEGEALGIQLFTAADIIPLRRALETCTSKEYFETAIQSCIDDKVEVWTSEVSAHECIEVDFPEDLILANNLLKRWV